MAFVYLLPRQPSDISLGAVTLPITDGYWSRACGHMIGIYNARLNVIVVGTLVNLNRNINHILKNNISTIVY